MSVPRPTPEPLIELIAEDLRVLGQPLRLRLIDYLERCGETTVEASQRAHITTPAVLLLREWRSVGRDARIRAKPCAPTSRRGPHETYPLAESRSDDTHHAGYSIRRRAIRRRGMRERRVDERVTHACDRAHGRSVAGRDIRCFRDRRQHHEPRSGRNSPSSGWH